MISYVYTFDYRDEEHQDPDSDSCNPPDPPRDNNGRDGSGRQDISGREEDQPALLSSVRVYAIADKYDIPPLKEMAKKRFETSAEKNWTHRDFSGIVKEIFESTPTSDRGLRDIATRIVASHADVLVQRDEFRWLIGEVGDLGLNILCLLLETHSKEKADLRDRLLQHESNLNRTSEKYHSIIKMINEWHGPCDRCKKKLFNAKVEPTTYTGINVRCKGCKKTSFIY
jgi:hypothetical protein